MINLRPEWFSDCHERLQVQRQLESQGYKVNWIVEES